MTETEIRKYDPDDTELKKLMGGKFLDKTQEAQSEPAKAESPKACEYPTEGTNKAYTERPDLYYKLKECAKTALTFGGLNLLIFYWQSAGLMEPSVAVPSMCVCAALFGFGIGKAVGK